MSDAPERPARETTMAKAGFIRPRMIVGVVVITLGLGVLAGLAVASFESSIPSTPSTPSTLVMPGMPAWATATIGPTSPAHRSQTTA